MKSILDTIVETKRAEVERLRPMTRDRNWRSSIASAPAILDFGKALSCHPEIRLIAEVKKASPSKGILRADFDPVLIAQAYEQAGAAALSVLTDETYFRGSLDDLRRIRDHVQIPILRKDFIIDELQIEEARMAGADAILLIAECLTADRLRELYEYTRSLGMHCLMEFYQREHLDAVLATGCPIVGINNRDLHSFEVDLNHTVRMRNLIPADRVVVGESGIATFADAQMLKRAGVQAILVGESLVRQPDVGKAVRKLLGKED